MSPCRREVGDGAVEAGDAVGARRADDLVADAPDVPPPNCRKARGPICARRARSTITGWPVMRVAVSMTRKRSKRSPSLFLRAAGLRISFAQTLRRVVIEWGSCGAHRVSIRRSSWRRRGPRGFRLPRIGTFRQLAHEKSLAAEVHRPRRPARRASLRRSASTRARSPPMRRWTRSVPIEAPPSGDPSGRRSPPSRRC